ncbi:TetR family transcriptional regulator [Mesorhizobium sp. NBSH29]|uniref:TetR/AcrR family transcriptional regulator n=1 Tax=Mesorhizobium sp. NBSH29 TaxID=2654249 RepID=UPI0018967D1E|nr:TetR/AcrR family transcriptional regulator [Mesorhizobium sp. NBSH29]QPC85428.1 TetR family transcriptional regulator [Mesorhizobium sp. NBSH29]
MTRKNYHHGDLRIALLDAAETELTEKGVEGFTLRGCARRAGVSHAAPAHHFRSADTLLTALAVRGFDGFVVMMRQRRQRRPAGMSTHVAAGLGYIDFALAKPALFRLMFSSARPDRSDLALNQSADAAYGLLVDAVRERQGQSGREDIAPFLAASWALVHGLSELMLAGRMPQLEQLTGVERDQALIEIIERGMN